jgi:hypothetical protein
MTPWCVPTTMPLVRGASQPRGRTQKGAPKPREEDEALGRSRGGFSTKVHLACDGKGRPLSVVVTPGQRHGSTQLKELLDAVRVPRLWAARRADPVSGPLAYSPTGATASKAVGGCCVDAASPTPSPSARTRGIAAPGAPVVVRASTKRLTAGATWSRGA